MRKNASLEPSKTPSLINPLEDLLGYQLRRASQAMLGDLASALDDLALSPTRVSVMELIASNPGITQSRIGQILAVERANMAPITAKLKKRGLVRPSRADGRSYGLHLTPVGKALMKTIRKRIANHENKFWKDAKVAERDAMVAFLKCLWKAPV
jgi:DNA-binding MarR family transcriptional regulator